jgi:hypothetical protein
MSRSTSTSWPSVPDSMQASFTHDPLSTNPQSRLTSDPSNYQLSSRSDPSRAMRVQGLPDPYNISDSPDKGHLALPKYIKRLQAHGTRRRRSNIDGRVSLDTSTEEIDNPPTSVSDTIVSPRQDGETIVVGQAETISVERYNVSEESVCKVEPGIHTLDEGDAPSVREQESRTSSHLIEEQVESRDGVTSSNAMDEVESVGNIADDEVVGGFPLNNGRTSSEVSEKVEDPSPNASGNDLSNAQGIDRLSDKSNASDSKLDKDRDLDENEPLDEAGEDVPRVSNPRKQRKKQGKRRSSQRKHIIDLIIGHRLGSQVNIRALF